MEIEANIVVKLLAQVGVTNRDIERVGILAQWLQLLQRWLRSAAGVIEGIACIMAVQNDIVPPTINHFTDDPELDPRLNFTFWEAQKRKVDAALSNTFGFGGHNACMIFKKYSA